jgi:hypothetical protein
MIRDTRFRLDRIENDTKPYMKTIQIGSPIWIRNDSERQCFFVRIEQ